MLSSHAVSRSRSKNDSHSPSSAWVAERIAAATAVICDDCGVGGGLQSAMAMRSTLRKDFGGRLSILWYTYSSRRAMF